MKRLATIDGIYRYLLVRDWSDLLTVERRTCLFVMLNPSTADASQDDPTIRRCIAFAKGWGYSRLEVVNLFALRATDPRELELVTDPVGPGNDAAIQEAAERAQLIVCAWGTKGQLFYRDVTAARLLEGRTLHCLARTKDGHPGHPLYQRADLTPAPFEVPRAPALPVLEVVS